MELIRSITRCARRPRCTVLQRRSCGEFSLLTQPASSSRCSNVTSDGSSIPRSAAISACVSMRSARDKCRSVRHFAWLSPIGLRRASSFKRHARAAPCRSDPTASESGLDIIVRLLTNREPPALSTAFGALANLEQNHFPISIIFNRKNRLRSSRQPAIAFFRFLFALRLNQ